MRKTAAHPFVYISPMAASLGLLLTATDAFSQEAGTALPRPAPLMAGYLDKCGKKDDSQLVKDYDGTLGVSVDYVKLHSNSTLQLQWKSKVEITNKLPGYDPGNVGGERWCTGTLVAEDLVLTAGHCFDTQDGRDYWRTPFKRGADGSNSYAEPPVLATLMHTNFGYLVEDGPADVFPVVELKEWRLGPDKLDYAVLRIGRDSQGNFANFKYHPIARVRIDDPRKGDMIGIIQHPNGNPMKVEAGPIFDITGHKLFYDDVDTFGGSSGSGIRDQNGIVVGVHTNAGCEKGFVIGGRLVHANRGVRNSSIAKVSTILPDLAK